jgi:NAD(P)-dependent dehydrogenase (short-subunit alcohol dehydrogenase family)
MKRQSAVVVGGATGIGRACVEALAVMGWSVVSGDLRHDRESTVDYLGVRCVFADATQQTDLDALVRIAEDVAPVRAALYTAGLETHGTVVDMTEEHWSQIIDVNLTGAFRLGKAVIPAMRRAEGGSYVVMSSAQAFATEQGAGAYAATKAAVVSLVRAMALDHGSEGIRVNAVAPGSVDTPLLRSNAVAISAADPDAVLSHWASLHALGRLATPSEIAQVVAFLLDDRSSFVTGSTWLADGGLLASY